MNDWISSPRDSVVLLTTLAASGISYFWLLSQNRRRPGGFGTIGAPAILAAYSGLVMLPFGSLVVWSGLLGFLLSLVGGFLFDQAGIARSREERTGREKNSGPLALWGFGAFLYTLAPAGSYIEGWRPTLENWSGAGVWVGVGALLGQMLNQVWRRFGAGSVPLGLSSPMVSNPRVGRLGASIATAIALWLFLPSVGIGTNGFGTKAPANSFLVSTHVIENSPLYILDIAAATYRPLNIEGGWARWSRDGTRIALTRKEQGWMRLFAGNADGSGLQQLADTHGVMDCVWSADGERIYFTHGDSFLQTKLSVVPSTGGNVEEVLPLSDAVTLPQLSPDGRSLAYFKSTDFAGSTPKAIKILNLSTGQATVVMSQPTSEWNVTGLAWTPDGQTIILSAQAAGFNGPSRLQRLNVSDGQLSELSEPLDFTLRSFTWISEGSLAMIATADKVSVVMAEIWLVDPDTGNRRRLETNSSPARLASIHASN
jgi:hypothetical protein